MAVAMIVLVLWLPLPMGVAAAASDKALPGCPSMCGDVQIPYPFGIGDDCAWASMDKYFAITCESRFNPPRPYWGNYTEIIDISVETGEMRVFSPVSYVCYNLSSTIEPGAVANLNIKLNGSAMLISPTHNQFTAIGCSTLARLQGGEDSESDYFAGCITYCKSLDDAADDGDECTGLGCCQTSIPGNLSLATLFWRSKGSNFIPNSAWTYSPCSYAFIGEKGWYKFNRSDLRRDGSSSFRSRVGARTIPLVLDWAIRRDGSCQPPPKDAGALSKPNASACVSAHSYCVDATQGPGYLCNCSEGYSGNPYVTGSEGCTNMNECELRKSNLTKYGKLYPCHNDATCHDTDGGYECKCKFGLRGDGKSEEGCLPVFPAYAIAILVPCLIIILASFVALEFERRKHRRFFDKNGGEILKSVGISIFTERQLKKITNGYSKPIGEGAFGKVFMGTIDNAQLVAVKRATVNGNALPKEEFVNEITFQFRINHANLVRLVGCCLETDIPMLVFEFVPNGSLYNVLHGGTNDRQVLSLKQRLDIAIGSAEALAFMHSHGGQNHVHGDVKSANILLDDTLMPKVSDFGSSKLVSKSMYVRCVACDRNCIDPVYMLTDRFTAKSDVYSFGVVLLELITRKTVMYGNNSLTMDFKKSWKDEGNGRKMYDRDILSGEDAQPSMECLDRVGGLAILCLKDVDADERPTMAEVVKELKEVKSKACGDESTQMEKEDY